MPSNKGRLATTLPDGSIQWQEWGYGEALDHLRADLQLNAATDIAAGTISAALTHDADFSGGVINSAEKSALLYNLGIGRPGRVYRAAAYTSSASVWNAGFFDAVDHDNSGNFVFNGTWVYKCPVTGWYDCRARQSAITPNTGQRVITSIHSCDSSGHVTTGSNASELARGGDITSVKVLDIVGTMVSEMLYLSAGTFLTSATWTEVSMTLEISSALNYFTVQQLGL